MRTTNSPRDHADAADIHVHGGAGHFTAGELKVAHPAAAMFDRRGGRSSSHVLERTISEESLGLL